MRTVGVAHLTCYETGMVTVYKSVSVTFSNWQQKDIAPKKRGQERNKKQSNTQSHKHTSHTIIFTSAQQHHDKATTKVQGVQNPQHQAPTTNAQQNPPASPSQTPHPHPMLGPHPHRHTLSIPHNLSRRRTHPHPLLLSSLKIGRRGIKGGIPSICRKGLGGTV